MNRTEEVLRQYRRGKEPGRIARDLKIPRDEVWAILNGKNSWERLGRSGGPLADEILAALKRHEGDYAVSGLEPQIDLLLELADRLDATGWRSQEGRPHVLFSFENALNSLVSGFAWSESVLGQIHLRIILKSLGVPEKQWPKWAARREEAA